MARDFPFIPLSISTKYEGEALPAASKELKDEMLQRRSCRDYSEREVPESVVRDLLQIAASAPSGANKQPWHFVAVRNPEIKKRIREAAEAEEKLFYEERAPQEWLEDLAPLGTDWRKPFLTKAPWLLVVFKEIYGQDENGSKNKHYYVNESVGIASGFLIAAIHHLGLATLTHTPSPMNFLSEILERPPHQKPFLLLPLGYPADDAQVPDLGKKAFEEHSSLLK
ncbi:nitroreductase family protein [Croceimicrobium sp.]|uniref:nitroreductase family protein n=1 Tax=Croceimicrobium sp. TaxID=2828340 RepID=UPI003BAB395C